MSKSVIATLGPKDSYSEILARRMFPEKDADIRLFDLIEDIFVAVKKSKADIGIVPIENMIHGSVRETTVCLNRYNLKINKAMDFPISHCFAAQSNSFKKIISHPQAIAQCSCFIRKYVAKGIEIVECSSTSKAMEIASENAEYAAIGSACAAKSNNLPIISSNVENVSGNITRFIQISRDPGKNGLENTRTSMILSPSEDRPGLLFEILSIFKIKNINLTKIESISTGKQLGQYIFFIEIDASIDDPSMKKTMDFMKTIVTVNLLGTYEVVKVI